MLFFIMVVNDPTAPMDFLTPTATPPSGNVAENMPQTVSNSHFYNFINTSNGYILSLHIKYILDILYDINTTVSQNIFPYVKFMSCNISFVILVILVLRLQFAAMQFLFFPTCFRNTMMLT